MSGQARSYLTRDGRSFLVRFARPADADQVIANINSVCAEGIYLATECFVPTPHWERVLYHPGDFPDHLLLVAEVDGQVIGECRVFPNDFGQKARHVADLGIEIIQPFREIGIGAALMKCAIKWARARGYEKLTVDTFSTNLRAINLFKKMGFATPGVRHKQYKVGGEYVDELLMERFLQQLRA